MKKLYAVCLVFSILSILGCSKLANQPIETQIGADKVSFAEPPRKAEIPANLIWNEDTNEYFDSDIIYWDGIKKSYVEKVKPNIDKDLTIMSPDQWIESKRDSNNRIDQALIKYHHEVKKLVQENPMLAIKSNYDPDEDKALIHITNLGIAYLPEMKKRIEANEHWAGTLMTGFAQISKVQKLKFVSVDPQGLKKWISDLDEIIESAEAKVKSKTNIEDTGIFGLPYIVDEVTKGNKDMSKYLSTIIGVEGANNETLNSWIKDNKDTIEIVRSMNKH